VSTFASGPTLSRKQLRLIRLVNAAGDLVDRLYEARRFRQAEHLDALLSETEELLEDNGDYEEGADLENNLLSEVDEDGAHEIATELPEDETHDDDLDFAYERGLYAPERIARFNDDSDGDLDFLHEEERRAKHP
jgi:hypothetical protein